MAKKKETLTIDKKLENALVPSSEQPYPVPANWCWTRLTSNFENVTSSTKKIPQKEYFSQGKYPIIDQGQLFVGGYSDDIKMLYDHELPVVLFGDHTRNIKFIDFSFIQGADGVKLLLPLTSWNRKCFFYALQALNIEDLGYRRHFPIFKNLYMPLPPLAEQKRIVDRIESLFAKLDQAKALAQSALDRFENRKSAILYQAFTGELTQQWREQNGILLDSWEIKTLMNMCYSICDGDHMPPPKSEYGIPFLVISNINKGVLNFEKTRFVPKEYYDNLSASRKPKLNDILYTIVGSLGIPTIVDDERAFCFQRHIALLKPQNTHSKFLWYLFQCQTTYQKATEIATGTAQLTIPIKGLRALTFEIPTLPEQQEIVRILDSLLEKEATAKKLTNVIDQIDLIKKALLARAFRGELATNNKTDPNAQDLLKQILEVK